MSAFCGSPAMSGSPCAAFKRTASSTIWLFAASVVASSSGGTASDAPRPGTLSASGS